jgi:MoxR-like ATPase
VPVRARGDQLAAVLASLEAASPDHGAAPESLAEGLAEAADQAPRRSLVIVLSDLLDPRPELPAALRRLATAGREVAVFQLLAPEEEGFPYDGRRKFLSDELPDSSLTVDARAVRRGYLKALTSLRESISKAAAETGITFLSRSTAEAPARIILDWIGARQAGGGRAAHRRAAR